MEESCRTALDYIYPLFLFTATKPQCLSTWESKFQLSYKEVKLTGLDAAAAAQTQLPDIGVVQIGGLFYYYFFLSAIFQKGRRYFVLFISL